MVLLMFVFIAMALFDHVNLVYGTVSEFCTPSGCPDMTGPGQRYYTFMLLFPLYNGQIASYQIRLTFVCKLVQS